MFLALGSVAVIESTVRMAQTTKNDDAQVVNVALLGAGIFAREAHLPAILNNRSFCLKAIYSRTMASAQALASSVSDEVQLYDDSTLDKLLARDDINAVVVCLPIVSQPDIIRRAFKAGKSVLSEKPVAKDVQNAVDLIREHEERYSHLLWLIAEQFGFEPAVKKANKFVRSIGKIRHFGIFYPTFLAEDIAGSLLTQTLYRGMPDLQRNRKQQISCH
jgi:predicted dehydrogenase